MRRDDDHRPLDKRIEPNNTVEMMMVVVALGVETWISMER